jgi:dienelactone hydrolase
VSVRWAVCLMVAALLFVGCKRRPSPTEPTPTPPGGCDAPFSVGFRVVEFGGLNVGVWYPTSDREETFQYAQNAPGTGARDGDVNRCSRFPLVVFSHGFGGCGLQSLFITEELARRGYIVAAPDHRDSLCSVRGTGMPRFVYTDESFLSPETWTEQSQADRRVDLDRTITGMQGSGEFSSALRSNRVGAIGHSLGGYAVLGMAGGWSGWKDDRISAVLALSPFVAPFLVQNRLSSIRVPVMYQGSQLDIGITPSLPPAFSASNSPKYFVELLLGNHFIWTNLECGSRTPSDCLRADATARLINDYSIAFLDRYLKDDAGPLSRLSGAGVATFRSDP